MKIQVALSSAPMVSESASRLDAAKAKIGRLEKLIEATKARKNYKTSEKLKASVKRRTGLIKDLKVKIKELAKGEKAKPAKKAAAKPAAKKTAKKTETVTIKKRGVVKKVKVETKPAKKAATKKPKAVKPNNPAAEKPAKKAAVKAPANDKKAQLKAQLTALHQKLADAKAAGKSDKELRKLRSEIETVAERMANV